MIIYVDLLFIINYFFDLTTLVCVDVLLKRNISVKRLCLFSLIGELSLFSLLTNNALIFNIIIPIIMCTASFKYKNLKYTIINVIYYYLVSILLGGFIYFLTNQFKIDLVYSLRYILVLVFSPIVIIIYYYLTKELKDNYNNLYNVRIEYDKYTFNGNGFLDSGNNLIFNGKKVILIEKKYIHYKKLKLLPVLYNSLNYTGIVFCFKPDKVYIKDVLYTDVLVGLSDKSFNIDGAEVLLNCKLGGLL